jgi:tetratricopeptide (TPR) repeat protein
MLALLALVALPGFVRAADDAALRKKALALNEVTGLAAMRGQLQAMLDDKDGTRQLVKAAAAIAKEQPKSFTRNATYLLALAAEQIKEVEISAAFFRLNAKQELALQSETGLAQAYGGLIQMYYEHGKFAESEKVCREFLELDGSEGGEDSAVERLKPLVMRRLVLAVAKRGQLDKALGMADKLVKEYPDNWLMLALKGQVLRDGERLDDAVKVYLSVIDKVKKDRRLEKDERDDYVDEYRYLLSGLYVDLNQVDKAAEVLKALLAKDPNNPAYNNDLGFIWADHGMNLEESEKLIRKAIEQERKLKRKLNPDLKSGEVKANAAYLDSLGWVLFKQGKLKEAKAPLQQAVKEKEGQNTEIYEHLGDVLMALGEKAEAIAAYKKALEVVGLGKRDQKRKVEIEKKLKARE